MIMKKKPARREMKMTVSDDEWKRKLPPACYHILREKGTEPAFIGKFLHNKEKGVYVCAGCGSELFSSDTKFESGTGWPSFFSAVSKNIETKEDRSHSMVRTEVLCKKCGGHLGHLFDDGPTTIRRANGTSVRATGLRYCINSLALGFRKKK